MNHRRVSLAVYLLGTGLLAVALSLLTISASAARAARASTSVGQYVSARNGDLSGSSGPTIYLPLVLRSFFPPMETAFGAEIGAMTDANGLGLLADAGSTWIRKPAVQWNEVETTEGVYNWSVLSGLETELANAHSRGMKVILIVRGTPAWAQKIPGSTCGPILASKLGAFANFLTELVNRYKGGPYRVSFWEIWNEPDIDPSQLPDPNSYWGCWGDKTDAVGYGGGYYADMLKVAYPAIRAADAEAHVLLGGLLLDCDPSINPDPKCNASKFLNGILDNGGGPYFDGVSFHAYDYYYASLGTYGNFLNWGTQWNLVGPSTVAKALFLKNVLSAHGVSGKFLMNTEAAVLCTGGCDANWETTKAYYVAEAYAAGIAQGLRANIWYFWRDRHSELFASDLTPLPAYGAYVVARQAMADATYIRDITEFTGIRGHEMRRGGRRVWLLSAIDGSSHGITLPGTPLSAYDVFGTALPTSSPFAVGRKPVYLEWYP